MPGKSGPERVSRLGSVTDIFLLRGAVPVPKPSYGDPRRASCSGSFVTSSQSVDIPYTSNNRRLYLSSSEDPSVEPVVFAKSSEHPTSSSAGVWSSSQYTSLLEKASLDKSIESDVEDRSNNTNQSEKILRRKPSDSSYSGKDKTIRDTPPTSSVESTSSTVVSGRHRIVVISGKECGVLPDEEKDSQNIPPPLPNTPIPDQGQRHLLSPDPETEVAAPPLPLTPIPNINVTPVTVNLQQREFGERPVPAKSELDKSLKSSGVSELSVQAVKAPVLSGLERLRQIEEKQLRSSSEKGPDSEKDAGIKDQREPDREAPSWTSTHFNNRRDLFERMASRDTCQSVSDSELGPSHPSPQKSEASLDLDQTTTGGSSQQISNSSGSDDSHRWVPSDTILTEKKPSDIASDLSTHSLGGGSAGHSAAQRPSGAFVSKVKDVSKGSSDESPDEKHHTQLHKTASSEDVTFSPHLSPHHEKHYKLHKTSSEEDVSFMKNIQEVDGQNLEDHQIYPKEPVVEEEPVHQKGEEQQVILKMESKSASIMSPTGLVQVQNGREVANESSRKKIEVASTPSPHDHAHLVLAELKESFESPTMANRRNSLTNEPLTLRYDTQVKTKTESDTVTSESRSSDTEEKDVQEEMEKRMYQQEEITMNVQTITMNNDESDFKNHEQDKYDTSDSPHEFFYHGQILSSASGYNASEESGSDAENFQKRRTVLVRKEFKPEAVNSELKAITSIDTRATSLQDGRYIEPKKMETNTYFLKKIPAEESSGAEDTRMPRQNVLFRKRKIKGSQPEDDFTSSDVGHTTEVVSSQNEWDHDTTDDTLSEVLNRTMSKEEKLQLQSILSSSSSVKKRDSKVHFDETHLSETKYYKPSENSNLSEISNVDGQKMDTESRESSSEEDTPNRVVNGEPQRKSRSKNKSVRKRIKNPDISSESEFGGSTDEKHESSINCKNLPSGSSQYLSSTMIQALAEKLSPLVIREVLSAERQTETTPLSDSSSEEFALLMSTLLQRALESEANIEEDVDQNDNSHMDQTRVDNPSTSSKLVDKYEAMIFDRDHNKKVRKPTKADKTTKYEKLASKSVVAAATKAKQHSGGKPGQLPFGSLPCLSPATLNALSQQVKPLVMEEMMTIDGQRETMALPESASNEISRLLSSLLQGAMESILRANAESERDTHDSSHMIAMPDNMYSSSAETVQRIETIDAGRDVSDDKGCEANLGDLCKPFSHSTPSKLLRKTLAREIQHENGGIDSIDSITSPSDLLLKYQNNIDTRELNKINANRSIGNDKRIPQFKNSADRFITVKDTLERPSVPSLKENNTAVSAMSVPLPLSKTEEKLKQLEQRSTPIKTSLAKLLPQRGIIDGAQTRSHEDYHDGCHKHVLCPNETSEQWKNSCNRIKTDQAQDVIGVALPLSKIEEKLKQLEQRSTPISTSPTKLLGQRKSMEETQTRSHEDYIDKCRYVNVINPEQTKSFGKRTNLNEKSGKLTHDISELPRCKTPMELQSVIDTMKYVAHGKDRERSDIDLGLERDSTLYIGEAHQSNGNIAPYVYGSHEFFTENEVHDPPRDVSRSRLEALLSRMAQQDKDQTLKERQIQRIASQVSHRGQSSDRKSANAYTSDVSQAGQSNQSVDEITDELTDAFHLPVTQSAPIPNHVISSVARLIFQKQFQDNATSDPQLSPEALDMLFSLMSIQSSDEPHEGCDVSDSTYSSSVPSSSNAVRSPMVASQTENADTISMSDVRALSGYNHLSPETKDDDMLNTSSADSMETNAPSSELHNSSDLDALGQNSELEKLTKSLSSKIASDLSIENIIRFCYEYAKQSRSFHDNGMTDGLTETFKPDKITGSSEDLYTNTLCLPPFSGTLPKSDDAQKSQEVLNSSHHVSTSRGASPGADQALSTGRKSAMGSTDMRSYLIEKELIESQLRKLQVENSSMHTENKLLKEKYNRAQTRIASLENELLTRRQETESMHSTLDEMSVSSRKSRSHKEQESRELEEKVLRLTKEVDRLKAENSSLEHQLNSYRRTSDVLNHTSDRSQIIEGFREELVAMRAELSKMRDLLDQAEKDRVAESEKRKEASAQVVKLTEIKALLQQQLENSGGTVAEKQVKSLESRLKITEDRLHQERSDRAGKLSELEEKLLSENAKLQVSEKELKRQLNREKDKNRNLDNKYKAVKEDTEKLQVVLADKPASMQNMPYHAKYATMNPSLVNKKASDMKYIQEQLKKNDNLSANQSEDAIWLLWQRNQELTKCLKQWELQLGDLGVDYNNITEGLQNLRSELELYDDKLQHYKDTLEDSKKERDSLEQSLKRQVKDLVHEKHGSEAHVKNLEDQCAAIRAENDSLINSLRASSGMAPAKHGDVNTYEAQVESLKCELHTTRSDLQQQLRQQQRLEAELESVWAQHRAKEKALDETLQELTRVGTSDRGKEELEHYKQQKSEQLKAEVRHLEVEAGHWKQKYESMKGEQEALEEETSKLRQQLAKAKFTGDGHIIDPASEAEKSALEEELNEKDLQVMHLSVSYNETENDLQRTKQLLVLQQQSNNQLMQEMDQLHADVRQKKNLLEKMASTETDHQVELASLRENLLGMNSEFTKLTEELKLRSIELDHHKSKVNKLERDLNERDHLISSGITKALQEGSLSSVLLDSEMSTAEDTLTHAETQARLLQYEVDKLKHQTEKINGALENLVSENANLVSKNRHLQQELVQERAKLCQLTTNKVESDQKLHILEENEKGLVREKACLEQDITKQEVQLANFIDKLEKEAEHVQRDYEEKYQQLDKEGKKLAIDFTSVKHLLQAREREIELLRDTIDRQKQENLSMARKLQVVKEENSNHHQQMDNLTKELTRKMKEQDIQKEASQTLASERARLQLEKSQLEQQQSKENESVHTRLLELQALQKKLERTEELQRQTQNQVHEKENQIVTMETELRHTKKDVSQVENEKLSLKNQVNTLSEEVRHLKSVKETLEQRLNLEKNSLSKEKQDKTCTQDDLSQATQQLQVVKREYDILYANLEQEKKIVQAVKAQLQAQEERSQRLQDEVTRMRSEQEISQKELNLTKETLELCKHDKQTLYQDMQDLCSQLSAKDLVLTRLKDKTEDMLDAMKNECTLEKSYILQEKQKIENDLYKTRQELEEMTEKMRQKEHQIDLFMRTNKDLENDAKEKYELESEISNLSVNLKESQKTMSRLEADNARLNEASRHLQDNLKESRETNVCQKLRIQELEGELARETHILKKQCEEAKRAREKEGSQLNDLLHKSKLELKAVQASLAAAQESRDSLLEVNKTNEKAVDNLKTRLHEETIGRKLAEQKVESATTQLNDLKANKNNYSSLTTDLQARYAKIEAELNVEKERFMRLQKEFEELHSSNSHSMATAKSLEIQLSETESENSSLRSQVDTTKQDYMGKNKRLSLEMRQSSENYEKDRTKLMAQAQQLSTDLDRAREQLAAKNRENLSLQEEMLSTEAKMREANSEAKHLRESIKLEQETRDKLDRRNMELELLLAKLRSKEGGSDTDSGFEATRAEVQRMLSELSQRMQGQLEQQKGSEHEARTRDQKKIEELKHKVASLESVFSQEQALHIVSKTQLQSLDEDNQRLRQTIQSMRKRQSNTDASDRTKSRIEAINEIIAKSQSQANQMLASGTFNLDLSDSQFKASGPYMGNTQVPLPNSQYWNLTSTLSPRTEQNRSMGSDELSLSMLNGTAMSK